jgi:hypothetical protein
MTVPVGEVEMDCAFCDSIIRFLPGTGEMEVVRVREEMKARERVTVAQARMRQQLEEEEAERWRQTAAKVAIAALPIVGRSAGRAAFEMALGGRRGCLGCGCALPFIVLLAGVASALALF